MLEKTPQIDTLVELVGRLDWTAEQLAEHRTERLRETLVHAAAHSRFWKQRLAGLDLERATVDDLTQVPVLTKAELMARWDDIVTVPGLTLDRCQRHLADLPDRPTLSDFELEGHVVQSTGGTSGTQAVIVNEPQQHDLGVLAFRRWPIRRAIALGASPDPEIVIASVTGDSPRHYGGALAVTQGIHQVPVGLPVDTQCHMLESIQPKVLMGYPSVLSRLAVAALDGHLDIEPVSVSSAGECLTSAIRASITTAWPQAGIFDAYGSTECGMFASSSGGDDPALYVNDDLYVLESLDEHGNPVTGDAVGAAVAVTCLEARALPLIRYELSDRVSFCTEPSPEGLAFTRINPPGGRVSDWLRWGDIEIHPYAFATPLTDDPGVELYQVRQTDSGADILVTETAGASYDEEQLLTEIGAALRTAGLDSPELSITRVDSIERVGEGRKHRVFVPLA